MASPKLLDQVRERLRVKDVDFKRRKIIVRGGKGGRGVLSPFDRLGAE